MNKTKVARQGKQIWETINRNKRNLQYNYYREKSNLSYAEIQR